MPFGFGNKSKRRTSPDLPMNGHPINNNLSNHQINGNGNSVSGEEDGHTDVKTIKKSAAQMPKLVFQCQLAHGSPTVYVSGFTNMKELYEKIGESFQIPHSEILYCTLNTHKVDMEKLLGGQIGLEDFIFVHRKGQPKEVEITKTEEFLGLTITDNGNGYAFVKKVREGSPADQCKFIMGGDHIEKINSNSMIGCRHYEVAKTLKEIPIGATFTIRFIEPLRAGFSNIGPRGTSASLSKKPSASLGSGRETLRLRAKGPATVEAEPSEAMQLALVQINSLLESFMGINDNELATQIWDLGKDKNNPHDFVLAIDSSDLEAFEFSDDFVFDLWGAVSDAKCGRLLNNAL